jgi:cytochrome-b5 reductase
MLPSVALSEDFTILRLRESHALSSSSQLLRFDLPGPEQVSGLALGQCVSLRMPRARGKSCFYSPLSLPSARGILDLLVSRPHEDGKGGSGLGAALVRLVPGQEVEVRGGVGIVGLPPDAPPETRLLLIGGGSGVVPLFQCLRALLEADARPQVTLVYAAGTPGELLFLPWLRRTAAGSGGRFNLRVTVDTVPSGCGPWDGRVGLIDVALLDDALRSLHPTAGDLSVVLAGPPPMVAAMRAHLSAVGVAAASVHTY